MADIEQKQEPTICNAESPVTCWAEELKSTFPVPTSASQPAAHHDASPFGGSKGGGPIESGQETSNQAADASKAKLLEVLKDIYNCPKRDLRAQVGIFFEQPEGSFADNLDAQSDRLAKILSPSCDKREPYNDIEIGSIFRWALKFGPAAVESLTEATNNKLTNAGIDTRVKAETEEKQAVYVSMTEAGKEANVTVSNSTIYISSAGKTEGHLSTGSIVPKPYDDQKQWLDKRVKELLKKAKG